MGTISVSLPSDGQTYDAADYNVPINTIVSEFNGGIDSANIEASGVVPNNLFTGTGTSWVWSAWTPTLSGRLDDADWTKNCTYIQIGKTVICHFSLVATAAAPMGGGVADAIFTLPVTSVAVVPTASSTTLGTASLLDAGTTILPGYFMHASTTTAIVRYHVQSTAAQGSITSTAPFTWTTSDSIGGIFIYQAA